MDKTVFIILIIAFLIAWIAWLIYNFKIINLDSACAAKVNYYKNRYNNLQDCMRDVINAIHTKFPKSTIQYIHNDEGIESVEGEIKY